MNAILPQRKRHSQHRRGSIYLAVVGVALIVSMVGMLSMSVARLELKSTQNRQDLEDARLLSHSALEFGLANMQNMTDWRTDATNGTEVVTPISVGYGTMTYSLVDEDGDLADNTNDNVYIQGIARVGEAVYATSVKLEPAGSGITSLEAALHTGENFLLWNTLTSDQVVSANGNVSVGATVNADLEAAGTISGSSNGSQTEGITPRQMPDTDSVFDYYIANGTVISISDIGTAIDRQVISPSSNPYGSTTNPLGIYVIDCQGTNLAIKDSRIHGTLVLLNAGSGSNVDKDINWEPYVANYPALMVQGNIIMKWNGDQNLRETQHSVNFNPVGSPFQGVEDSDTLDDDYPPLIKGLIYISNDLTINNECTIEGVVVVGNRVTTNSIMSLTYQDTFLNNPPPGFSAGTEMQIVPGTFTRVPY